MNLDIDNWKPFVTKKLFPVLRPGKANQQMLDEGDDCFYIGAKKDDNGVMLHCALNKELIQEGNCIIFICNGQGSVGYANYMDIDFIGTTDIIAGYNDNLNPFVGNFLATIYSLERPKYSFGRKWKTHLEETEIKLPAQKNEDGSFYFDPLYTYSDQGFIPDWHFMEDYIKSLHYKPIKTSNLQCEFCLNVHDWGEFCLGNLFSQIYKAEAHIKDLMDICEKSDENSIKFISRTENNNGCDCYVLKNDVSGIEDGKAITIGDTTSTMFFQDSDFVCGDHIVVCRADWMNIYTALFVLSVLNAERYRYSYGRSFKIELIKSTKIKLPQTSAGIPDWQYMEDYIKNLPYGDRI